MHSCYDKCALCELFTSFTCHIYTFYITSFGYSILHYLHTIVFTYFTLYIYKCATLMYFLSFFLADANFRLANFKLQYILSRRNNFSRNSFGKSSQQQNGMGICCGNLAKIFLPTPSHLVYIEKLVINVSSSCSTYCRNGDDGISSPPKFLAKFL